MAQSARAAAAAEARSLGSIKKRTIHLEATVQASAHLRIDVRAYLSVSHLRAAAYLAREAGRIERDHGPAEWSTVREVHRASVVGAILTSVAFLEATINEMLSDAGDGHLYEHLKGATPEKVQALATLAKTHTREGTLDKYEAAWQAVGNTAMDRNTGAPEEAIALVQLRNALVHYRPETIFATDTSGHTEEPHRLEKLLDGRFAPNPFTGKGNPFWPDKCLSDGCARWALAAASAFVEEFTKTSGLNVLSATTGGTVNSE